MTRMTRIEVHLWTATNEQVEEIRVRETIYFVNGNYDTSQRREIESEFNDLLIDPDSFNNLFVKQYFCTFIEGDDECV